MPLERLGSTIDAGRERLVVVKPQLRIDAAAVDAELAAKSGDEQVELEVECKMLVHEFERWMGKARNAAVAGPREV